MTCSIMYERKITPTVHKPPLSNALSLYQLSHHIKFDIPEAYPFCVMKYHNKLSPPVPTILKQLLIVYTYHPNPTASCTVITMYYYCDRQDTEMHDNQRQSYLEWHKNDVTVSARHFPSKYDSNMAVCVHCIRPL